MFSTSQCRLPINTYTNIESVSDMVDDTNITMTRLRMIFNYIRDSFGRRVILPEEAVHNLVTENMEAEYGSYKY